MTCFLATRHDPAPPFFFPLPQYTHHSPLTTHNTHSALTPPTRYIQMSAMIFGGMIEADARMVRYHHAVRSHKKLQSDMAVWRAYESEYEERGVPGVGAETKTAAGVEAGRK